MIDDTFKYKSVVIAKYIVAYANANHFAINMTKLQKLLYAVYGTYLAMKGERLTDEHPQAWPYGPVFPTTRNKLLKLSFDSIDFNDSDLSEFNADNETKQYVEVVFNNFGKFNAATLTAWSHSNGSPWETTTQKNGFKWGDRIDDETIQQYFNKIITRKDEQ